jgi:hypothetical protein
MTNQTAAPANQTANQTAATNQTSGNGQQQQQQQQQGNQTEQRPLGPILLQRVCQLPV